MKFVFLFFLLGGSVVSFALDREAFTFTGYDLEVHVEPAQQRLAVRGKIALRNASSAPQKNLALQVSSSLKWSSIRFNGNLLKFIPQIYSSDLDHTGALSEAIVTLPRAVAPGLTIELQIGYEGLIQQDAKRLTRIGVPAQVAGHSDWDQISPAFTAVRGIGYAAWYPISMEAASLSEGDSVFEAVGRWKQHSATANMKINLCADVSNAGTPLIVTNNVTTGAATGIGGSTGSQGGIGRSFSCMQVSFEPLGNTTPAFVMGNYEELKTQFGTVAYVPGHRKGAEAYASASQDVGSVISEWLGAPQTRAQVAELAGDEDSPFESGTLLLTSLTTLDAADYQLLAVLQFARLAFPSPRSWMHEGVAGFTQLEFIQKTQSREAVIGYLENHRGPLLALENQSAGQNHDQAEEHSLINATDEFYVAAKAMNVWWMLRDIVGEPALKAALHGYKIRDDRDASYMQNLIEAQAHRDLEWFFDDWVYRDRGLPDFKIDSVYPRQLLSGGYMVTVTVENLGAAAAEVPVILHMGKSESLQRLVVPGEAKASVRIQAATMPQEVTVNDGSVPESDSSNNTYKIE